MAGGPDEVTVTATVMAAVAAFRVGSPPYWATMLLAPICLPPEVNVMAPVGVAPLALVTVAVMVTEPVDATEVAVACRATDADARAEGPARHPAPGLWASPDPGPRAWSYPCPAA